MTTLIRMVVDKTAVDMDKENFQRNFALPQFTTTARDALIAPSTGMMIYNTTTGKVNVFTTGWEAITSA